MAKLGFIFKNEKDGWIHLEETELLMDIYNGNSTLYIGTKETRTLKEMTEGVERELKKRTLLKQDEKLEISAFDKSIIEFEENQKRKVSSTFYNFCKMGYKAVEEGKTTWEQLIQFANGSRCPQCM